MKSSGIFIVLIAIFSLKIGFNIADEIIETITESVTTTTTTSTTTTPTTTPFEERTLLLKPCARYDLDLDQCLKNLIQNQIHQNINGSETLNIPILEPWSLPRTKYLYTTSTIRMILTTENVKIHGLKRTTLINIDTKFNRNSNDALSGEMIIHFPKVRMSGNYSANIRVNNLKIRPKGRFNVTLVNVINNIKFTGIVENKYNQKRLQLKKFSLDPLIEDIRFNVTGVFPTDPQLNIVFVQFINSYWRNLYPLVIRETRSDWEPMLLNATNEFLGNIPFENLIN